MHHELFISHKLLTVELFHSIKRPKLHHHAKVPLIPPTGDQVVFSDDEELIHVSPPPVSELCDIKSVFHLSELAGQPDQSVN